MSDWDYEEKMKQPRYLGNKIELQRMSLDARERNFFDSKLDYVEPLILKEPHLSMVDINSVSTDVVKWYGDKSITRYGETRQQEIFLFPIITKGIDHWEVTHPCEVVLYYVGRFEEFLDDGLVKSVDFVVESVPAKPGEYVVVMHRDYQSAKTGKWLICPMVSRIIVDEVVHPKHYSWFASRPIFTKQA